MRFLYALLLLYIFTSGDVLAQKRKPKGNSYTKISKRVERQLLNNARKDLEYDDYDVAIKNYSELLQTDSLNPRYNFAMALTLYMNFQQPKAVPYFERAIRHTKDTIGDAYFFLATSYHLSGNFEMAEKNYVIYKSLLNRKGSFLPKNEDINLFNDVVRRIEMCENGKNMLASSAKNPLVRKGKKIVITDMGSNVNSKYDDYDAVFTGNDSTIFFTSRRENVTGGRIDYDEKYYEDIYFSTLTKDGWVPSANVGAPINTRKHEAIISVSADGKRIYFYKGVNQGTFYYSDLMKEGEKKLPPPNSQLSTNVLYRVQLGAYSKKSSLFENAEDSIELKIEDGLYKYMSGSFTSLALAHKKRDEFFEKGYKDAFVVAYKENKRVPIPGSERVPFPEERPGGKEWTSTTASEEINLSNKEKNERWSHQRVLLPKSEINNKSWETSLFGFAVTVADDELYIVSDREGGVGGRDIYVSKKMSDGTWGPLENLGAPINSAYDEDAPYLTPDGNTMYFSSNGHNSIGGFDVFVSYRRGNTNKWSEPINLGMPLNTPGDDIFFSFFHNSERAYYSSSGYAPDSSRDLDNYYIDFCDTVPENTVKGIAKGFTDGSITVTEATAKRDTGSRVVETQKFIIANGKYAMKLKLGKRYKFSFETKGINPVHMEFSIPEQCHLYDIYQEISFSKPGDSLKIENAFFDIAKATLNAGDTSYTEFLSKADKSKLSNYSGLSFPTALKTFTDTIKTFTDTIRAEVSTKTDTIRHTTQTTITFNNILFDFDKAIIKSEFKPDLNKVVSYLKETAPTDKIEVAGHTDSKGPDAYNLGLSKRRANVVAVYFVTNGVEKKRMKVVGYGETMPVAPNENSDGSDNKAGRKKNRRTEIKVLATDVQAVLEDYFNDKNIYTTKEINELVSPLNQENANEKKSQSKPQNVKR